MKPSHLAVMSVTLVLGLLTTPAIRAEDHSTHLMLTPSDLVWTDVASLPPGAKVAVIEGPLDEAKPFMIRLIFPANYKVPVHWHPAIEHATVLSGTLNMGAGDTFDKSKTKPLSAGSVSIMQPNTNHFAWTKEETVLQVHGVGPWAVNYVNPLDDPRKK